MIKDPPLLPSGRNFPRPTPAQLAALADVPTGYAVDAMDGRGALDHRIKPLAAGEKPMIGVAITCHCGPADNLALFARSPSARPGDILVAATDGFTATAIVGDLFMGMARNRGVAGLVTDGLVRDLRRHPGRRPAGLLRRPHPQFAGANRARDGRPAGGGRRLGRRVPATSSSATSTESSSSGVRRRLLSSPSWRTSVQPKRRSTPRSGVACRCRSSSRACWRRTGWWRWSEKALQRGRTDDLHRRCHPQLSSSRTRGPRL